MVHNLMQEWILVRQSQFLESEHNIENIDGKVYDSESGRSSGKLAQSNELGSWGPLPWPCIQFTMLYCKVSTYSIT